MLIRRFSRYNNAMGQGYIFFVYLLALVIGLLFEISLTKLHHHLSKRGYTEHRFSIGKYFFLLSFPFVATVSVVPFAGWKFVAILISFSVVGAFLEWLTGWSYHQVVGQKLWTYHRYPIGGGYTSVLTLPLWGLAGGFFWLLAMLFT